MVGVVLLPELFVGRELEEIVGVHGVAGLPIKQDELGVELAHGIGGAAKAMRAADERHLTKPQLELGHPLPRQVGVKASLGPFDRLVVGLVGSGPRLAAEPMFDHVVGDRAGIGGLGAFDPVVFPLSPSSQAQCTSPPDSLKRLMIVVTDGRRAPVPSS
jgi:hypothetical protein